MFYAGVSKRHLVFLIINYLDLQCEQRGYFTRVHPHLSETMFPVSRIYCSWPSGRLGVVLFFLRKKKHKTMETLFYTGVSKKHLEFILLFRRNKRALAAKENDKAGFSNKQVSERMFIMFYALVCSYFFEIRVKTLGTQAISPYGI